MGFNLYLDDIRTAPTGFVLARTAKQAKDYLKTGNVVVCSLDHDLGEQETGYDVAKYMVNNNIFPTKIIFHTSNFAIKKNMRILFLKYGSYRVVDLSTLEKTNY